MIRRELEKDPELKNENWERFLPHFKNRNVQRKKKVKKAGVRSIPLSKWEFIWDDGMRPRKRTRMCFHLSLLPEKRLGLAVCRGFGDLCQGSFMFSPFCLQDLQMETGEYFLNALA